MMWDLRVELVKSYFNHVKEIELDLVGGKIRANGHICINAGQN